MSDNHKLHETSGLASLHALIRGELPAPSIAETLGMHPVAAERGRFTLEARPDERHLNTAGAVHGGFAAACLDTAAGLALVSTLDSAVQHSTVDLNVKYVRPMQAGEVYQVNGWVVDRTRSLAICDAQVTGLGGKLYAKATTTFAIKG